jgi:bifunctional non-homologous end joining protein LigD
MPLAEAPPRESRFGRPLELRKVRWVRPELVAEVRCVRFLAELPLSPFADRLDEDAHWPDSFARRVPRRPPKR